MTVTEQERVQTLGALTRELENEQAVIARQKQKLSDAKGVEGMEAHVLHLEKDIAKRVRTVAAIKEQLTAHSARRARRGQRRA